MNLIKRKDIHFGWIEKCFSGKQENNFSGINIIDGVLKMGFENKSSSKQNKSGILPNSLNKIFINTTERQKIVKRYGHGIYLG